MSKTTESAKRAHEHLTALIQQLPQAEKNARDWLGVGWGQGGIGGGGSKGDHSDPTGSSAVDAMKRVAAGRPRDDAERDLAIIMDGVVTAELAARRVRDAVARCVAVGAGSLQSAEGCELCGRVLVGGKPHEASWQPIYTRIERPDNPQGQKLPLCSFHHEFYGRYGIFPCAAINEWHLGHLGARVPYAMLKDWHPDEFSLAQSKQRNRTMGRQNLGLSTTMTET